METMSSANVWFRGITTRCIRAAGYGSALIILLGGTAAAQQITVSGTVTSRAGAPLRSVTVQVEGTSTRVLTEANGSYRVVAPSNAALVFSLLGQRIVRVDISGRSVIDVTMEPVAFLEEVVVTGYTEQRRADITGAVASVDIENASRQTSASVLQRLDVSVPGVTVASSGSPGSRSTVRIRGVGSFQNNEPLYIVDGTPVQESYINWLNPNDITSIQVLKDASAASIYGSRASNGVVVIETSRRDAAGPPRATMRVRAGITSAIRGYDDFLITDALQYHEIVRRAYVNANLPVPTNIYGNPASPSVPAYIWPNNCTPNPCSNVDLSAYAYPTNLIMPGSAGTNWWDAVFGTGSVADYNLDIAGGGLDNRYGVSFNYFDQHGTAAYNRFQRGGARINTSFDRGRLSFGENIAFSVDRHVGGMPDDPAGFAEDGILGKNILMQPVVPVYDAQGNFASGKAVGLGNSTNPLKFAHARKDNNSRNNRLFGNVFAGFQALENLALRTTLGFNVAQGASRGFNPITPENAEPNASNSIFENNSDYMDWTWTNTLRYGHELDRHNFSLLLGQEANQITTRFMAGSCANVLSTSPDDWYVQDALCDAATKNVSTTGSQAALLSFFGRADYNFDDRYVASFTLRRDGSSRMGPANRWGTFPAFGLGWRLSNEPFFGDSRLFSDVLLRFGWGVTGNQFIPAGRIVSQFGGSRGDTHYDVGGTNNTVVAGFRQTSLGNPDLRWEENRSVNVGADLALLDRRVNFTIDVYQRGTSNLLFDPPLPGTAGLAAPPIENVGEMRNRGFDVSLGYSGLSWSVGFNGSHYRNEIVRIDGEQDFFYGPISTRFGNQIINQVGHPIGSFHGLIADGLFRDAADVAAHAVQPSAAPGRIKFRDIDGDGEITLADRTVIGSPHPDFTAGMDFQMRRGPFDLSATVFGTFGNEIFDVQKEFYVFRNFSTNVRRDLLTDSWTPVDPSLPRGQWTAQNPNAKYPIIDQNDDYSRTLSSFYVEDGSYVRLRNLQIGYNVPTTSRWFSASRIYVQGENLFTITGYPGLDPALPAANVFGPAGDIRDQYRGIDRGAYPSNRMFSVGLVTSF